MVSVLMKHEGIILFCRKNKILTSLEYLKENILKANICKATAATLPVRMIRPLIISFLIPDLHIFGMNLRAAERNECAFKVKGAFV